MVRSDRSVVDLLHKHFRSDLALSANLSALSRIVLNATMGESNIKQHVNSFTFFKLDYYIQCLFNTYCRSPVLHLDCTRRCRFTFLTLVGKISQCCRKGN